MARRPVLTWKNALRGAVIYTAGDTVAAILLGEFLITRLVGMALVGGIIYALEIPTYFACIDRRGLSPRTLKGVLGRTGLAMLYFNPLWIARHLLFIQLASGRFSEIGWDLVSIGAISFAVNIPVSLAGNYIIQNRLPCDWRFFGSALFSALLAVYYAVSAVIFG